MTFKWLISDFVWLSFCGDIIDAINVTQQSTLQHVTSMRYGKDATLWYSSDEWNELLQCGEVACCYVIRCNKFGIDYDIYIYIYIHMYIYIYIYMHTHICICIDDNVDKFPRLGQSPAKAPVIYYIHVYIYIYIYSSKYFWLILTLASLRSK